MTDSNDYRLYLEKCFKNIDEKFEGQSHHFNAEFENMHDKLDELNKVGIETRDEARKTNSRVTHLEEFKENVADKVIEERIRRDEFKELRDCAIATKKMVDVIDEDLSEYRAIKKYPKLALLLFAILIIGVIVTIVSSVDQFRNIGKEKTIIEKIDNLENEINDLKVEITN